ncbi:MAG: FHA domain-containing protein [Planctomycetota bacterium]|jgi:pSer/pThr/pTyr-binding forkhead associated (FHA) protein
MPYLVSVSGDRIPLRQGHTYTLGRGRKSDIVVHDRTCSRLHARIHVNPVRIQELVLEDLHSRNGTYLDGDPVPRRALMREGSRLRLGGSVFLVRLRDSDDEAQFADTSTVGFDDDSLHCDAEAGEIAQTGLIEILTRLLIERRDVTLRAALPDGAAHVEVRYGEVQRAIYGGLEGFNALVKLGRQTSGIFWLKDSDAPCRRQMAERPERLLSQLARCLEPAMATRRH